VQNNWWIEKMGESISRFPDSEIPKLNHEQDHNLFQGVFQRTDGKSELAHMDTTAAVNNDRVGINIGDNRTCSTYGFCGWWGSEIHL